MSRRLMFIFIPLAVMLSASPVLATIHYVPDDFPTIQSSLDGATSGDTIIVRDKTWVGPNNKNLDFGGKAITLRSENGPENCIIDCESDGRGFYFHNSETSASVVEGFKIINGRMMSGYPLDRGSGIYCSNSSPSIIDCIISSNSAVTVAGGIGCENHASPAISGCTIIDNWGGGAGGIYCGYDCSPTITGCTISNNSADIIGGGIACGYQSSPTITGCTISGNSASVQGGGIECESSSPVITNCTITNNVVTSQVNCGGSGGAIFSLDSSPTITGCTISGNSAACAGGGILFRNSFSPVITNCKISENAASFFAGGIHCFNSALTVTGCNIINNSGFMGGGIGCDDSSSLEAGNCTIAGNTASYGGGVCCSNSSTFTAINCTIGDNSADQSGGGICCSGASFFASINSILWGDTAGVGANEIYVDGTSSATTSYSDIQGGWPGVGNIEANPLFAGGGDYHLTPESPCIDVGTDAGVYTDIDGDMRPFDVPGIGKDGTGNEFDMGSDEYVTSQLTQIHLLAPADLSVLTSPPTFSWTVDGGINNVFAVDVALSPSGPIYSTYENLGQPIFETSLTVPASIWNKLPSGKRVYWRVRGVDLDETPLNIITSDEVWSFTKE